MEPLFEGNMQLQRFEGKGGWTYILLPKNIRGNNKAFGVRKVSGSIDAYNFELAHLMPMKGGDLFLPINAGIRKSIGKEAGDKVMLVLFSAEAPVAKYQDFFDCLDDEPGAKEFYNSLNKAGQQAYLDWIFETDSSEVQVERMVKSLEKLSRRLLHK
ncbi:hypothetical protein COR50_08690 [Chitinophaga caeni]|uniref:DUF1905 domain-containing protein n=1 Tax=Chitinophaga caeni TaxID=2029983 RepID=A0A291QTQ5_9BACT|nr:YdeI/OmpD-associated family protein [Chitinophaga caeni]ATL47243.1 hypothetical protein COR50_08690 [Chitinophaga caeni]